jgi:hypothetical protein
MGGREEQSEQQEGFQKDTHLIPMATGDLQIRRGKCELCHFVDRDIFAGYKTLIGEVKADLVESMGAGVVMESPAATLAMNEMTVIVLLVRPQSRDSACLTVLAPEHRLNPVIGIERRDDNIGDAGIAHGVTGFACKLDPYLPKLCRKRCIGLECAFCIWDRSQFMDCE